MAVLGRAVVADPLERVVHQPDGQSRVSGLLVPGLQVLLHVGTELVDGAPELLDPLGLLPVAVLDLPLGVFVDRHGALAVRLGHLLLLLVAGGHPSGHPIQLAVGRAGHQRAPTPVGSYVEHGGVLGAAP